MRYDLTEEDDLIKNSGLKLKNKSNRKTTSWRGDYTKYKVRITDNAYKIILI